MACAQLLRLIAKPLRVRIVVACLRRPLAEGARIHKLDAPELADCFGEMLTAAALLTAHTKGGVRQVLQLDGDDDAPIARMLAEARHGRVRGYVRRGRRKAPLPGEGLARWMRLPATLAVVRDLGFGHPYVSAVEADSPFLADAVARYLWQSVQVRADIRIAGAVGVLMEAMPQAPEAGWRKALGVLAGIPEAALRRVRSAKELLRWLDPLAPELLAEESWRYACDCSPERVAAGLATLSAEELRELAVNDTVEVVCEYCGKTHRVPV